VRFALAVLIAAAVQLVPYLRPDVPALLATAYLLFAALGAGFFAGRRGWLAGALSVLLGAAAYGLWARPVPATGGGPDLVDLVRAETALLAGVVPYAAGGALAGALGARLRARAMTAAR